MKYMTRFLAAIVLILTLSEASSAIRISNDRGGRIATYIFKYQRLASSGESVIIDGLCASACTIVLGKISHDRICVTSQAKLAFHAAWDFGARGLSITNRQATQMLYSMYPSPIRQWIDSRGGLRTRAIFLQGKQLNAMYRLCQVNGQRKPNA